MSSGVRLGLIGAAVMLLISCSSTTGEGQEPQRDGTSPTANDPALIAAANRIKPTLEESYSTTFAGLKLDHAQRIMIVYRRPDPKLDAFVKNSVQNVRIIMRDARYSLAQMSHAMDNVLRDTEYWHSQGIGITGALPKVDGSGIEVLATEDGPDIESKLTQRYPSIPLTVRKQRAVPPIYSGPVGPIDTPTSGTSGR